MKKRLFLVLLLCLPASAQSDSMLHVNQFPGTTVADKVTNAMAHCPAAPIPCILMIDASLAAAAPGVMPSLCGNCSLADYRQGLPNPLQIVVATSFASLASAVSACTSGSCEIDIPANSTISAGTTPINCSSGAILIHGQSRTSSIVQFSGAGDGMYNCQVEHVNLRSTNAGAGIALRMSGLLQTVADVEVSVSGAGKWATGIESLGAVSFALQQAYCDTGAADICVGAVDNGVNQTGNFTVVGGDLRGNVTGLYLSDVLSGTMHGGAIENSGTQGVLADTHPTFDFYGTHFEQNTTDLNWPTGGTLLLDGVQMPGGSATALNCPNTTCTARVMLLHSNIASCEAVTLGNAIAQGSILEGNLLCGGSLTIGLPRNVSAFANYGRDGTGIVDSIGVNSFGESTLNLTPGTSGFPCTIKADNTGKFTVTCNGITFLQNLGGADLEVGGGTNILYRCTVAGALPVGALTTATGNCGASGTADTGLRVK